MTRPILSDTPGYSESPALFQLSESGRQKEILCLVYTTVTALILPSKGSRLVAYFLNLCQPNMRKTYEAL